MEVTDETFEKQVLEKSGQIPVLVDFWAPWCQPCLILSPILEKIAQDYKDKIVVVKINVDENKQTAQQYSIMSIPSVKLFKHGKIKSESIGVKPESAIKQWIDENL